MRFLATTLALVVLGGTAWAEGNGPSAGGGVNGGSCFVGIIAPGRPGSGGAVGSPAGVTPYTYTWVPPGPVVAGLGPTCDASGGPGLPYGLVVRDLGGAV